MKMKMNRRVMKIKKEIHERKYMKRKTQKKVHRRKKNMKEIMKK